MKETQEASWVMVSGEIPLAHTDLFESVLFMAGVAGVQTITAEFLPPDGVLPPPEGQARLVFYHQISSEEDLTFIEAVKADWRRQAKALGLDEAMQTMQTSPLENDDWKTSWRRFFKPIRIRQRLIVLPGWEVNEEETNLLQVEMDPGLAFGTGAHETTAMLLDALVQLEEEEGIPERILDVGTGSGILSIAAIKLGAKDILALDNDPEAIRVAEENREKNSVNPAALALSLTPIEQVNSQFPLVMANIISGVLLEMKEALVQSVEPAGRLWLSGILREEREQFIKKFKSPALVLEREEKMGEWVALFFKMK